TSLVEDAALEATWHPQKVPVIANLRISATPHRATLVNVRSRSLRAREPCGTHIQHASTPAGCRPMLSLGRRSESLLIASVRSTCALVCSLLHIVVGSPWPHPERFAGVKSPHRSGLRMSACPPNSCPDRPCVCAPYFLNVYAEGAHVTQSLPRIAMAGLAIE